MRQNLHLIILLSLLNILSINAQTYYYKLCSYGKSGMEESKVSGGQFITFQAAICMETDKDGESIGNGYLKRKVGSPNIYIGSAYWGRNTKFEFSSDKSSLKVLAPNGIIYKYVRSTPPKGVLTSSLISSGSTNSSGSGYVPVIIPQVSNSSTNNSRPQKSNNPPRMCPYCRGKGTIVRTLSTSRFGVEKETKIQCYQCGIYYYPSSGHAHIYCSHCRGTGYIE